MSKPPEHALQRTSQKPPAAERKRAHLTALHVSLLPGGLENWNEHLGKSK